MGHRVGVPAATGGQAIRAGRAAAADARLRARAARPGRPEEQLAARRARGPCHSVRPAATAVVVPVGSGRDPRRPAGLRGRAARTAGRRADRRRHRLHQEGLRFGRGAAPIFGDRRPYRELPDRGVHRLRLGQGAGLGGPGAVSAQVLDRRPGAVSGSENPRGQALRDKARTGARWCCVRSAPRCRSPG